MAFRFLHTADLHLDSPLRSLALRDADLAALIAGATRHALRAIVDLALVEQLDAVLIAGDLYDGSQTSMKTARFLSGQLARLDQAGIRVFIIRGNHDAESQITRELTLPPAVHVFGSRAGVERIDTPSLRVAIHGLSFRDRHAPESLLPKYRAPVEGAVNIGLMHTSLNGAAGHDPYAPCTLADLQGSGFDYWALGHIHKRAVYPGAAMVVMPGIPQGRHMGETGAGSVTLVSIDDGGGVEVQERVVAEAEFARLDVDLSDLAEWSDWRAAIQTALEHAPRATPHLVARLTLMGQTPLAARLLREGDLALAEAQDIAQALGGVWVEKLVPDFGGPPPLHGELAALARLIDSDIRPSDGYTAALEDIRASLQAALPPELRKEFDSLDEAQITQGVAQVLAQLGGRG